MAHISSGVMSAWQISIGRIPHMISVTHDITERKRMEEGLRQANTKLNLLSSITRHDINNQILGLEGHLGLLKIKRPENASNVDILKAETAAKRIRAMIQFTKEYENVGVKAPVWQDVKAAVEKEDRYLVKPPVKLVNEIPAGTEVFADPLIVKVFHNLIDNAMRHGDKIRTLRFRVEERDGSQEIICEDDGIGISAERKKELFTHTSIDSHGFGLFLSREILAITAITIAEIGEPGKGAKFVISPPKDGIRRI